MDAPLESLWPRHSRARSQTPRHQMEVDLSSWANRQTRECQFGMVNKQIRVNPGNSIASLVGQNV
jgi:hypothetical protein